MKHGFLKVAAISPDTAEGALSNNVRVIKAAIAQAHANECAFAVFPRCVITGAAATDRRIPLMLAAKAEELLLDIAAFTLKRHIHCLISTPLLIDENIVYVTAVVHKGKVLAVIPESDRPVNFDEITLGDYAVPYSCDIIIKAINNDYLNIGIVSGTLAQGLSRADRLIELGASIIMHTATQPVNLDSPVYEAGIISAFTAHTKTAYVYSSGSESDQKIISKTVIIAEAGEVLASAYDGINNTALSDIDTERLLNIRVISAASPPPSCPSPPTAFIEIDTSPAFTALSRNIKRLPYLPDNYARYNYAAELLARECARSLRRNSLNKACLPSGRSINFLYALTVLSVMTEFYGIPKQNIAVLSAQTGHNQADNLIDRAVRQCGFFHADIPSKYADDRDEILTSQAISRWAAQNDAAVLGVKDMTDIALGRFGTPVDRVTGINMFSALPKTYLNAAAVNNTLRQPAAESLRAMAAAVNTSADFPYDVYDFIMYYFGGLGMSKNKVMYLLQNAFDDYTNHRLTTLLDHFLTKYLSEKSVPQDLTPDFMTHPTPFYRIGGEEILRPYVMQSPPM